MRRRRLPGGGPGGLQARLRGGAQVGSAHGDRRHDHPLGHSPLQPLTRRRDRRTRRDHRAALPPRLTGGGPMEAAWAEEYQGGSPEAERLVFDQLAKEIMRVQLKNQRAPSAHGVPHPVDRAFHAKSTLAVEDAELRFLDIPPELRVEFAQPDATYPTVVRFSNASGSGQPHSKSDLRGVALRIQVSPEQQQDLLMTNYPVSHARDAHQFVKFATATAGGRLSRALGIVRLRSPFGPSEAVR